MANDERYNNDTELDGYRTRNGPLATSAEKAMTHGLDGRATSNFDRTVRIYLRLLPPIPTNL